jgi:O-acetyl-ADP-ribose deacetylase (regulator of RNase III)
MGYEVTENEKEKMERTTQFRLVMAIGHLFTASAAHSLAHCISKECKSRRATAKMFRDEFGRINEIRDQKVNTGGVAILNLEQRVIYNLVIKEKDFDRPPHDSLRGALEAMRRDAIDRDVRNIAMPRIGCGAERLDWNQTKHLLVSIFKDTDIEITVYTNALRDDEQIDSESAGEMRKR